MNTGLEGKPSREFHIRFTERIYRLHLTGVTNHSPRGAGVFEIVLFPPGASDGEILYVGVEKEGGSVYETLKAVIEGRGGLPPDALKTVQENISNAYFDAVSSGDFENGEDLADLAWALVQTKKPRLNDLQSQPHSGRYGSISYKET